MRRVARAAAGLVFALWLPAQAQQVVPLDLKPGSLDNPVNIKAHGRTVAAFLCVPDGFDPTLINIDTVKLEKAKAERCGTEDVNEDLCADLVCQFPTEKIGITCETTTVVATATLEDGTQVAGGDLVRPVPCKGKGKPPHDDKGKPSHDDTGKPPHTKD